VRVSHILRSIGQAYSITVKSFPEITLILDDWGLAPLSDDNRRDLLELLEDRHDCRATIVTSQLPVEHWHAAIGEPTLADAILDRLVHNAYKIALQGDSMRKRQAAVLKQAPAM
jgi:DNA replication protein DnaC